MGRPDALTSPLSPEQVLAWISTRASSASAADLQEFLRSHGRPDSFRLARRQCALARRITPGLYTFLTRNTPGAPALPDLTSAGGFEPDGPDAWRLDDSTRQRFLADWQSPDHEPDWRRWNLELAAFHEQHPDASSRLDRLHHLAIADPPEAARVFETAYAEADAAFDLPQCQALLDTLRRQAGWIGPSLAATLRERTQYLQARLLFYEDFFRTASFLERPSLTAAWRSFLASPGPRWILHLHATGGMGKTHFLRWLAARNLVPSRIPCARLDFDDFRLVDVVTRPMRLLTSLVDQLDRQLPEASLTPLLERLRREQEQPGWNPDFLTEISRQLRGARIHTDVVVILDTLEEATLGHADWLASCLSQLAHLRQGIPRLRLILSGRYNLADRLPNFPLAETQVVEITRFSLDEADHYLASRGIHTPSIRSAVTARSDGNPFKLSLLAEIVLNRPDYSEADIRDLPKVDLAYLIERVILRIPGQPLRWMIRYGAIPRLLTRDFIREVLLPPLQRALAGNQHSDRPPAFPGLRSRGAVDVWHPDPAALANLGTDPLWSELRQYARQRGWIEPVGDAVRFHPEVIQPTRELLRDQPIHAELQQAAAAFATNRAGSSTEPRERTQWLCESVFHTFHADSPDAERHWESLVTHTRATDPDAALTLACELLKPEYRDSAERRPNSPQGGGLVRPESILRAHELAAGILAQRAGLEPLRISSAWTEFQRHVEEGTRLAQTNGLRPFAPALVALLAACLAIDDASAFRALKEALRLARHRRTQILIRIQIAERRASSDPLEATREYRRILELLPDAGLSAPTAYEIHLRIAELHLARGDTRNSTLASQAAQAAQAGPSYAAAQSTLEGARDSLQGSDPTRTAEVLVRAAELALDHGDLPTAVDRIEGLRLPRARRGSGRGGGPGADQAQDPRQYLLEARLALACEDAPGALRSLEHLLPGGEGTALLSAKAYELAAQAHARCFDFESAFNALERAAKLFDDAGDPEAPARLLCLRLRILAFDQQNVAAALTLFDQAERLRSAAPPGHLAELAILRAWCLDKAGDRSAAEQALAPDSLPGSGFSLLSLARLAVARAAFATNASQTRNHLADARGHVHGMEPASARLATLCDLHAFPRNPNAQPTAAQALVKELPSYPATHPGALARHLRIADLHRVLGDGDAATRSLEAAAQSTLPRPDSPSFGGPALQLLLATWRWPGPGPLRSRILAIWNAPATLRNTPSGALPVLEILEAEQALSDGDAIRAGESLARAGNAFASRPQQDIWAVHLIDLALRVREALPPDQPPNTDISPEEFHAELRRLRETLGHGSARGSAAAPTPPNAPEGGSPESAAPADPSADCIVRLPGNNPDLIPPGTPVLWEQVIDMLLGTPRETIQALARRLSEAAQGLSPGDRALLRIDPGPAQALPWELTRSPLRLESILRIPSSPRTQPVARTAVPVHGQPPTTSSAPPVVHLLRARQGRATRGSTDGAQTQGWSIETGYFVAFRRPPEISFAPEPDAVATSFQRLPPALLHISAAIREFSGGTFLDFESTEERTFAVRGEDRGFWTVTLLDRLLAGLPFPPFVVLDIAHPFNDAEALRMMLLRNLFAADLFALGHTRGVLATGLARQEDSTGAYVTFTAGLAAGASAQSLLDTMVGPQPDADALFAQRPLPLFPHATALFTSTPDSPVVPPGPRAAHTP